MLRRSAAALFGALWLASAQAAPPPIEDFFKQAEYQEPRLSQDGKHVAFASRTADGRGGIVVVDLMDPARSRSFGSQQDLTVFDIRWVNDKRLIYDVVKGAIGSDNWLTRQVYAANIDGTEATLLIDSYTGVEAPARGDRIFGWNWKIQRVLRDGSADVLLQGAMYDNRHEFREMRLVRLDTRNGAWHSLSAQAPEGANAWWTDSDGHVVAVNAVKKGHASIFIPDGEAWKLVASGDAFTQAGIPFVPLDAAEPGKLWVIGADPERRTDTSVLSQIDLDHPEAPPKVLLSLPGYDFWGSLDVDAQSRKMIGVHYENDAKGTLWFDERMRALQAEVDKALPTTINQISCNDCFGSSPVLVRAESDRQPPVYLRYDRDAHKPSLLLRSRPWIDPRQMGRREFLHFKARDGLSIPVMITQPPGPARAHRPAVVLVHGGPWVRGTHWADWGAAAEAQFLASRGYVVIEPEFRGSAGYGDKLLRAGFKQWGLAMQDDVSDAMDFAVAQGWVDPDRVCIGGASYGGYATLMGLAKEPDRYRCGFEWVGVTDIQLMYDISWSDSSETWKTYGMPQMVGDRVKDAQQLRATSPIQLAARINKPLLLAYGGADRRVPRKHGEAFLAAVKAGNDQVEWVLYPNEQHGWFALETHVDFWGRVEKLLARTIGETANH